ncbi:MAG: hypothetical protein JWO38_5741 [Gemmataceae bacterium]|nr:hypothetical protein [Gemmataceae bacterium]
MNLLRGRATGRGVSIVVLVGSVMASTASGVEDDLDRTLAQLRRHQEGVKTVRLRAQGMRLVVKGGKTARFGPSTSGIKGPNPPVDEITELKQDFLLDFARLRYRHAYEVKLNNKLESWVQVFDGEKIYGAKIDVPIDQIDDIRPATMSIISGGDKVNYYNSDWWPFFLCQGFILSNFDQRYYNHDFKPLIDKSGLFYRRQSQIRDRLCGVIQTFPAGSKESSHQFEYTIDKDTGVVLRQVELIGGNRHVQIDIEYSGFDGRPIPKGWMNESFVSGSSRPWKSESLTVTAVELNAEFPDAIYHLIPQPGTVVTEQRFPSGPIEMLKNAAEKKTIYQADESGRLVEGDVVNGEFHPKHTYLWWWISGGAVLIVLVGWGVYRRRSRSRAHHPS